MNNVLKTVEVGAGKRGILTHNNVLYSGGILE